MMLIKRNLLLFFRDRANVFFSLLAVFIIIGLYVLFLGDMMEQSLREQLGFDSDKIGVIMASVTLAGMVAVTSVTSSLGAIGVSISDKDRAAKDFLTSPVSRGKITMSYMFGSATVGFVMTLAALTTVLAYLALNGGALPDAAGFMRLLFTAVLSVLCGNAIVFFISVFVKSLNAFTALSTVIGAMIGFLMGIYIPIGQLPSAVQWIIKCFPITHAASMFKQVLADGELAGLFMGAPTEALDSFRKTYGVIFEYGDFVSGFWSSAAVLTATTAVFCAASLAVMKLRPQQKI
ncbi:MAG: ABC transporter permease [Oscillospiraceae bacterium]|nr:ABC transporter permease [Oscillospiraceae bacterium]